MVSRKKGTVGKYHDFSATQILREIIFKDSRSSNLPSLQFWTFNFGFDEFLLNLRAEMYPQSKFRVSKMVKMALFDASNWPKSNSRKIRVPEKLLNLNTVKVKPFCFLIELAINFTKNSSFQLFVYKISSLHYAPETFKMWS